MATLKGLQDKIAKLQAQAEAIAKKESSAVFGKIRDLMEKHGLTPGVAKYVDPKTGATWTGRGRAPAWIANAKNRDKFLASPNDQSKAVAEKKPKSGNYVRGP